jgi:hypothetical protein
MISLYDETGNKILASANTATKGLNQYTISTSGISKGMYICHVTFSDELLAEKIFVN